MQFDHYLIRPLEANDLPAYFGLVERNRHRLEFFTGTTSRTKTFEDTRVFLSEMLQRNQDTTYFPYFIVDTTNNKIIGFIDLKNIDWKIPKSEIGYYMDGSYAGKGIMSKALRLFCEYCFQKFKFEKLFLRTHESNHAAKAVAEKCGFELEGTIRRDYKTSSGKIIDLLYYGNVR